MDTYDKEQNTKVSFLFPRVLTERMDEVAVNIGVSRSQLLRKSTKEYLHFLENQYQRNNPQMVWVFLVEKYWKSGVFHNIQRRLDMLETITSWNWTNILLGLIVIQKCFDNLLQGNILDEGQEIKNILRRIANRD